MLNKIKEKLDSMTDSQKVIGRYILENYSLVASLSAAEFAHEVGVSDATIVRFAQELGFSGFTEMKNNIKSQLRGNAPHLQFFESSGTPEEKREQIHTMGSSDIKGLNELFQNYDEDLMDKAAQAIFKARTIYFAALGSATTLQDFLTLHLHHMGFSTMAVSENNAMNFEKLINIAKDDLLIAISFPRYSLNTCKAIQYAKKQGANIIGITDSVKSPIGLDSNITLAVSSPTKTFFNSYVIPMALCNILLMRIFLYNRREIETKIKTHIEKLDFINTLDS